MRDEEEEQRKEKRKKLDEKLYRNFCRTKFYRWISLGEKKKKQAQREATLLSFFLYLPLFRLPLPSSSLFFFSFLQSSPTNEFISARNRIVRNLLIRG